MLDQKYVEHKPDSSYSLVMKHEIDMLSISKTSLALPFGSAVYRIQQFPGDLDLFEEIEECCNEPEAIHKFIDGFKKVVRDVLDSKLHYYSEVKAGLDLRYNIDLGKLENGRWIQNPDLVNIINDMYELFSVEDFRIIRLAMREFGANNYDVVSNIIREYRVLRWSAQEILAGRKEVLGGTIILDRVIVDTKSLFKIDEITLVQGKFAEVTNVYFLSYDDGQGGKHEIIKQNLNFLEDLRNEIEKLYYSDMFYNPFKVLKRMFALSQSPVNRSDPDYINLLNNIIPFISSTTSLCYQVKSELESIKVILASSKSIPETTINQSIDGMKFRLASYLEIPKNELQLINHSIDMIVATNNREVKADLISALIKKLKVYISRATIIYMNSVGINPPPRFVLPDKHKYNRSLVREPNANPENPIKIIEKGVSLVTASGLNANHPERALASMILGQDRYY